MAEFTYKEIMADLKRKIYQPVYFLTGEEPYFIDSIAEQIEHKILSQDEKSFNLIILYGRDVSGHTVCDYASQLPMMGNYQVIIIREAQDLDDMDALKHYFENPNPKSILALCYKNKKFDKRKQLYKVLQSKTVYFESKKLTEKQVPSWIVEFLNEKGYSISPKAITLLADYTGTEISKLSNEIGKLIINLPQNTQITDIHIEQNIGINRDYNSFELIAALTGKDILKANRIVNHFAANPKTNSIFMLLPVLFDFFVKVLIYHETNPKTDRNALAAAMGVPVFYLDQYQSAASKYQPAKLKSIFSYLSEYDLKAKGVNNAGVTEGDLMKELIFKILH